MVPYGLDTPLILGVLEIGVFITLVLFGVVFSQGYTYFSRNSANDGWRLRTFVGILIALEFAHTVASAHAIYYFTVVEAGISEELKNANTYSLSLTPVLETIITAMVQSFFAWRIRLLSSSGPRTLVSWALPLVCWTLCLLRFVGGMAMGVEAFNDIPLEPDYFHYQDTYAWVIASALDIGVVLDVLITLSMCFYINKLNSPYNVEGSEVLIKRLIKWTIQTGLITSLTSIAVVITFSTMKHNFIWLALYTVLAKLYSNSLLVSLNARPVNRQIVRGTGESAAPLKTWSPNPTPRPSPPGSPRPSLDIRITQTRTIATDPPVESSLPAFSQLASISRAGSPSTEMGLLTVPEKAAYVRSLV